MFGPFILRIQRVCKFGVGNETFFKKLNQHVHLNQYDHADCRLTGIVRFLPGRFGHDLRILRQLSAAFRYQSAMCCQANLISPRYNQHVHLDLHMSSHY